MRPKRSKTLTILAPAALLRVGALADAGLVLLGVASGIVLRTYLRGRR